MRSPRQQPCPCVARWPKTAAITQVPDSRGHEGHTGVIGRVVSKQLKHQLEGAVDEGRMQMVLIQTFGDGFGCVQYRECNLLVQPAMAYCLERRTVSQAACQRERGMTAIGEVRLTNRQWPERAIQPDRRGFPQYAAGHVQGPGLCAQLFPRLDRQLSIPRIHCATYQPARLFGEQQGC